MNWLTLHVPYSILDIVYFSLSYYAFLDIFQYAICTTLVILSVLYKSSEISCFFIALLIVTRDVTTSSWGVCGQVHNSL